MRPLAMDPELSKVKDWAPATEVARSDAATRAVAASFGANEKLRNDALNRMRALRKKGDLMPTGRARLVRTAYRRTP